VSETFIIGNREFTCHRMNAFAASKMQLRLQKIVMPVLGSLIGTGKGVGDMDVKEAAAAISEHLSEDMLDTLVLPMFAEAKVFCHEPKCFIKTGADIDKVFTAENLFDFYELIYEVGKYQFAPFFAQMAGRFGNLLGDGKTQAQLPM
jgi:hypothetical protein